MCARFELTVLPAVLARRFGLQAVPPLPNMSEFRPTDRALVIEAGPAAVLQSWGLQADWQPGRPLINARAESLDRRRAFRPLLNRRCLVPVSAWFEWRKTAEAKLKNRIAPAEGGLLALAGLSDGERFTVITCDADPGLSRIHDRMPVVVEAAAETAWLDPAKDFAAVRDLLRPYPAARLTTTEESPDQGDLFG